MDKVDKQYMSKIAPLYKGWNETLIWSCLEGYMGNAWVDNIDNPNSAQIVVGDFCFFAGVPNVDLVGNYIDEYMPSTLLIAFDNEEWQPLIELEHKDNFEKSLRYGIKKEDNIFNKEKLNLYLNQLPENYHIKKIDKPLSEKILSENWCRSLCSNYQTYEAFQDLGIGYVILDREQIVCGASSYTVYSKGIEIEIDTKEEYRRKGLALICASKLILECLDRGLYPSWDAANKASVSLAEKLGYHFDKEYVIYYVDVEKE